MSKQKKTRAEEPSRTGGSVSVEGTAKKKGARPWRVLTENLECLAIAIVILAITTLAILASFVPRVRALEGSETLGNYFILLFAVAIGTLTDFGALIHSGSTLFLFTALTLYGAILLHYILCTIFRIDADTAIITSTAAVFGPAFIPPIAEALDNKDMLLTGLTTGLVGYAVGNYLGLGLAYLVRGLTG
jgi:uncharacterized membrane protein